VKLSKLPVASPDPVLANSISPISRVRVLLSVELPPAVNMQVLPPNPCHWLSDETKLTVDSPALAKDAPKSNARRLTGNPVTVTQRVPQIAKYILGRRNWMILGNWPKTERYAFGNISNNQTISHAQ